MPHLRNRHVLDCISKRLTFSPVLAVQGARQTGKSVLVRDILAKKLPKAKYITFDSRTQAVFAQENPESFLALNSEFNPLILDEAQKAPHVFDAIKLNIDQNRRPGRYLLLGSTEFSHLTRVRESLTGRMGRIRIYPLTLSETQNLPLRPVTLKKLFLEKPRVTRAQTLKHLTRGGMPGFFAVRNESERLRLMEDWLTLTCERDALQIQGVKIEPALCLAILRQVAVLTEPDAGNISKSLLRDPRKIKSHLAVLETLFVLQKVEPHTGSTGKPLYYLLDAGLADFLGASFQRSLTTMIKTELDVLLACHDIPLARMTYFRSRSGGFIHFIIETPKEIAAIKILNQDALDMREVEILKSFQNRTSGKKLYCYALGGGRFSLKKEKVEVYPWESVG